MIEALMAQATQSPEVVQTAKLGIGPTIAIIGGAIGLISHIIGVTWFLAKIYFELKARSEDYEDMKIDVKGIRGEMHSMNERLVAKIEKNAERLGELSVQTAALVAKFGGKAR